MATNCEDVSARMMELLYGELPDAARTTLETHLAGCARCRAELDGFQKTRALARTALDEPPPSRARAAILSAAAAHAAAAQATAPQPARVEARPRARGTGTERAPFWAWLRARWALPTLATVGAVAVFLLGSRLFLDPERTYERGQRPLLPTPAEEKAPVAGALKEDDVQRATAPVAAPASSGAGPSGIAHAARSREPADGDGRKLRESAQASALKAARPVAAVAGAGKKQAKPASAAYDDGLDELLSVEKHSEKHKGKAEGGPEVGALGGLGSRSPGGGAPAPAERDRVALPPPPSANVAVAPATAATAKAAPAKEAAADRAFAPAPPPRPSRTAQAPAGERRKLAADDSAEQEEAPLAKSATSTDKRAPAAPRADLSRAPAPVAQEQTAAPPPPAPTFAAKKKSGGASLGDAAEAPAASTPAPPPAAETKKSDAGRGKGSGAAETLVQRADRLFTQGRWPEAAAAYRDLLRNDPRNSDADRWRRRLAVATQAEGDTAARHTAPAAADRQR